jgi:16S rRNA processing protein RimM
MVIEQFVVGFIRGKHGLAGEFKVESASGYYDHIAALKEVTLRHGSEQKVFQVEYAEPADTTLYMKLAGIDTPEAAARLNGWEIIVPRKYAHPLTADEWYIEDLKQCSLIYRNSESGKDGLAEEAAPADETVGTITNVLEGGSGDLLEVSLSESCRLLADGVKLTASGKPRKVMVPFNERFIGAVDMRNNTVELMHLWILE